MKALCWHGAKDIRCDEVPDPRIEHPRDAIVKVTSCAICGSDLHLYDGLYAGHGEWRRHGPRVHGRSRGGGARQQARLEGRRARRHSVHDHLRRMRAVPARQLLGLRAVQPEQRRRRQDVRPHHRGPVRLHAISRAATPAARRNMSGCRTPTRRTSRYPRTDFPMSRCCSWATSFRPAGRPRCNATSSPPTRWPYGAADRSDR